MRRVGAERQAERRFDALAAHPHVAEEMVVQLGEAADRLGPCGEARTLPRLRDKPGSRRIDRNLRQDVHVGINGDPRRLGGKVHLEGGAAAADDVTAAAAEPADVAPLRDQLQAGPRRQGPLHADLRSRELRDIARHRIIGPLDRDEHRPRPIRQGKCAEHHQGDQQRLAAVEPLLGRQPSRREVSTITHS